MDFDALVPDLPSLASPALRSQLQHALDHKTKPLHSLGQLESLALRLGHILGTLHPVLDQPQLLVFAADHGLAHQGVSAYPSDVTWQMVENFLAGGAAVSVLARQHGVALNVIDMGVRHDFGPRAHLIDAKVAHGTADASVGPAMTIAQCRQALTAGAQVVRSRPGNVILLGEMGIGNTSSASLLMAQLTGHPLADCIGRGTGLNDTQLAHKSAVLTRALQRHAQVHTPLEALAALGGFEIAGLVGAVWEAAAQGRIILVDGFITSVAVMVAAACAPNVLERCIFSHESAEQGHRLLLSHLNAEPLLRWHLRLGEGSGAALVWPLLESACRILRDMASFEQAGVDPAIERG